MTFSNTGITRAIVKSFSEKFLSAVESDCLIAGAGPSGLYAAYLLAKAGRKVVVVEKRLSPGGGIWGGGMTMNEIVVQREVKPILDELEIAAKKTGDGLYLVDSVELAAGLAYHAVKAGATILNVTVVEDVAVRDGRVTGLVVNRSTVYGTLHVDPLVLEAKATVDATGHEAAVVQALLKHGVKIKTRTGAAVGEGPMDAPEGERFVAENTGEVYPGLLVSGMAVCAAFGGPRMGPIFGGMLLSGKRIAEIVEGTLKGD